MEYENKRYLFHVNRPLVQVSVNTMTYNVSQSLEAKDAVLWGIDAKNKPVYDTALARRASRVGGKGSDLYVTV